MCWTPLFKRLWTLTTCGLVLVAAPLMPSSSSATCRRRTSLLTSNFICLCWPWEDFQHPEKLFCGPWGVWGRGLGCTYHPRHVHGCWKPGPCQWWVQQGVWLELVCIRDLYSAPCLSALCSMPCCASSLLVCHRSFTGNSLEECIATLKVWKIEWTQGTETKHKDDKDHDIQSWARPSSWLWWISLSRLSGCCCC